MDINELIITRIDEIGCNSEVENAVRCHLLDWLGCLIGALNTPAADTIKAVCTIDGYGQHTMIGSGEKETLGGAVFANASIGHILELDDVYKPSVSHPAVVVFPSAFAATELENSDFSHFSLAVASGYEIFALLGNAMMPSHYKYWHTTGTCGTFAAAICTGRLLGLNHEQMIHSMGIAATTAAGLVSVFGSQAKLATVGNAARNGVYAALLAKHGMDAAENAVSALNGYISATSTGFEISNYSSDTLAILDTTYKIHASCGHTHPAIDALLYVTEKEKISWKDVASIQVKTYRTAVELTGAFKYATEAEARFSLPYCLAVALVNRHVDIEDFSKEMRQNEVILDLGRRILISEDSESTAGFPKLRRQTINIALKDGRRYSCTRDQSDGFPEKRILEQKFRTLSSKIIPEPIADQIIANVNAVQGSDSVLDFLREIERMIEYGLQYA